MNINGKEIETTANGYLVDHNDWDEDVAKALAEAEDIELTDKHWDLIKYLRSEYVSNGNNPNTRTMIKELGKIWGTKIGSKDLYALFPKDPSKQGGRISGLPESKRKGGY
ncbi:MAG: TusE/DsrC/DsvC family sulfur relay protein [Gammaproteobacteria bacterium]|nr:TusE/DsrC/DsvC family sulfur relay protein [Gammaproteobacteria bacterium]